YRGRRPGDHRAGAAGAPVSHRSGDGGADRGGGGAVRSVTGRASNWVAVAAFAIAAVPLVVQGWGSYRVSLRDEYEEIVVGTAVPEFTGSTTTGESWALSEMRGLVVLVNAWRSGCQPCRDT